MHWENYTVSKIVMHCISHRAPPHPARTMQKAVRFWKEDFLLRFPRWQYKTVVQKRNIYFKVQIFRKELPGTALWTTDRQSKQKCKQISFLSLSLSLVDISSAQLGESLKGFKVWLVGILETVHKFCRWFGTRASRWELNFVVLGEMFSDRLLVDLW